MAVAEGAGFGGAEAALGAAGVVCVAWATRIGAGAAGALAAGKLAAGALAAGVLAGGALAAGGVSGPA
jgi:hypothetical protein